MTRKDDPVQFAVVELLEAEAMGRADYIGVVVSLHDTHKAACEAFGAMTDIPRGQYYTVGPARGLVVGSDYP